MYKIKLKKDYSFRGVDYKKGESYEVSIKVFRVLKSEGVLDTKKKSKKEDTLEDLYNKYINF